MSDTFTAADLEPSREERRRARRAVIDGMAAAVAVLATGLWAGGLVALGACAAPFVFELTPAPFSGDAMGAAFARFDSIAIGCAVVLLGAEVARSWLARRERTTIWARLRRVAAIAIAGCAVFIGLRLTPQINELHHAGARRNVGPDGTALDSAHRQAELFGKIELGLAPAIVLLHVLTLRRRRPDDDDDEADAAAPLAPGPAAPGHAAGRGDGAAGARAPRTGAGRRPLPDEPSLPVEPEAGDEADGPPDDGRRTAEDG